MHICPVCGKEFKNSSGLSGHLQMKEDDAHKKYNEPFPNKIIGTNPAYNGVEIGTPETTVPALNERDKRVTDKAKEIVDEEEEIFEDFKIYHKQKKDREIIEKYIVSYINPKFASGEWVTKEAADAAVTAAVDANEIKNEEEIKDLKERHTFELATAYDNGFNKGNVIRCINCGASSPANELIISCPACIQQQQQMQQIPQQEEDPFLNLLMLRSIINP